MLYPDLLNTVPTTPAPAYARRNRGLRWLSLVLEFAGAAWILWWHFPRLQRAGKLDQIRSWANRVLRILEVDVVCHGLPPPEFAGLMVSNHVSWLDILVIQSLTPGVFVAKAEVARWPLVGSVARACATIFVQRSSARSARAMADASMAALAQGYRVVGFPEGTSSDGSDVGAFHSNIFECAIKAKTPVQPLSLRYVNAQTGLPSQAPVFVGDTSLALSLRRVMATSSIQVRLHFGACIPVADQSRKTLAAQAHRSIREQLLGHGADPVTNVHAALSR